ncbi:MAG TPA: hypothetical protein VGC67_13565 [Cellulomonas sp.]
MTHPDDRGSAEGDLSREQLALRVRPDLLPLYRDTYRAFGWDVTSMQPTAGRPGQVLVRLTRARTTRNFALLGGLQRQAEGALHQIAHLERAPRVAARAGALTIAILATTTTGSAVLLRSGHGTLSILAAVVGVALCGAARGARALVARRTAQRLAPLLERQYDLVDQSCAQAAHLLSVHS